MRSQLTLAVVAGLLVAVGIGFLDAGSHAAARSRRLSAALGAPQNEPVPETGPPTGGHWIAAWGASAMPASIADRISERGFRGQTLREIVFSSVGGAYVRVHFTNSFGRRPLKIARAAVAEAAAGPEIVPGSSRKLTFRGKPNVTIPPGDEVTSDPVPLAVPALSRLAVSLYLPRATGPTTQHAQAHVTNWVASGSHILDGGAAFDRQTGNWFFLDAVDAYVPWRDRGTVVALGDSITAGVGSLSNADASWPDDLARRLATLTGPTLSVVDEGIGGNRVLNGSVCCGASAVSRFGADVAGQLGVRDVILLEGINDIGFSRNHGPLTAPHTNVSAAQIIAGYKQIIAQAHARGLRIFGATLLPFKGARYWSPAGEAKRERVNHWITTSHAFDGVIDFATVMRDPARPLHLNPRYDSGDHLHPNDAGYAAMANAIDLAELTAAATTSPSTARRSARSRRAAGTSYTTRAAAARRARRRRAAARARAAAAGRRRRAASGDRPQRDL